MVGHLVTEDDERALLGQPNNQLLDLAERVEKATGEDAYLDLDIHKALNPDMAECFTLTDAPAYTASLDAAMTLVPEGWAFKLGRNWCELWPIWSELGDDGFPDDWGWEDRQHHAATPALALTAAALKARAHD